MLTSTRTRRERERERERERMVRVTDNRWDHPMHDVCKYRRHGWKLICAGTRRSTEHDCCLTSAVSILPDIEYSTINSVRSLALGCELRLKT